MTEIKEDSTIKIESGTVSREIAEAEIGKWLDYKRISKSKRSGGLADNIEQLVEWIEDGTLILNDKTQLVQKLQFPAGNDNQYREFIFKPRIAVSAIDAKMKGLKPGDTNGRVRAYVSALTGVPMGVLASMDTEDYSVGQALAIFFI